MPRDKIKVVMNGVEPEDKPTVRRRRLAGLMTWQAIEHFDKSFVREEHVSLLYQ